MIKCVAFDLWDTLVYLEHGWRTFNFLKETFEIEHSFWVDKVKPLFLCRAQKDEGSFLRELQAVLGREIDIPHYAERMRKQRGEDARCFRVYADALPALSNLKKMGLDVGVISNQCSFYESFLLDTGVADLVDPVIFSNRIGVRKPDSRIYLAFLRLTKVEPSEILMVGNHIRQDYEIPRELGMNALLLDRTCKVSDQGILKIASLDEITRYL